MTEKDIRAATDAVTDAVVEAREPKRAWARPEVTLIEEAGSAERFNPLQMVFAR